MSLIIFFRQKRRQQDIVAPAEDPEVAHNQVAEELENEARDAFVKKKSSSHSLPSEMVKKLCSFLDKHGEDFEVS